MKIKPSPYSNLVAVLGNLLLAYAVYMVTRVAFVMENWKLFSPDWGSLSFWELLAGSLRFDSSAILYTNSLWIVLMLLPLHLKERPWWHTMCKWIYVVINSLAVTLNLTDAVYSQFTGRRTTASFFSEFSNENNLGGIIFTELFNHWYLLLLGIALIAVLWFLYLKPSHSVSTLKFLRLSHYYPIQAVALVIAIPMAIFAMRGGFTRDTRPITISNANQYVHVPSQASIVLNTPFSLIRTIGKSPFRNPQFFPDEEVERLYSPLHTPSGADTVPLVSGKKNVVVLILESFSREYFGFYNQHREGHVSYTPFLDSLLNHSLTYEYTFANGRKSIDAMPSILASIPMFVEPFILTSSSLNDINGLAGCLADKGYASAFYHGAPNSSMGFQAFARSAGFQHYYGMTEYCNDSRFHGRDDFDGHWAIWDEEFMQFMALSMGENLQEPFVTGFFSASSHHPFRIPERYESTFPEGELTIHRTIRYSDNALRLFFETAKKQPWFKNTLFVITADHTNQLQYDESMTSLGAYYVPIVFYDPSGELPQGMRPGVAQQNDILPTVLRILGYDKPFIAFGKNLLNDEVPSWAVNYNNGIYQYVDGNLLLLFDGEKATALYDFVADPLQKKDLLGTLPEREEEMTSRLKAIIQSYMLRMTENNLVVH